MEMVMAILRQILTMLLLVAVGYLMYRGGRITQEGSRTLGNLLIYLSLPCVIINSFLVERTSERVAGFLISAGIAAVVLAAGMLISRLILGRNAIDNFAGSFSNPGFFGVPLIVAALNPGSVFYVAAFIALMNLLQWSYGVSLLERSGADGMLPLKGARAGSAGSVYSLVKRLIKAPFMIAILIGMLFFLTGLTMPSILRECISFIGGMNTPVAMFTIGIYMAQTDVKKMFAKPRLYLVSLVRLIVIPLAVILMLWALPVSLYELKIAILIAAACPVGSNIAVYAQLHNSDYAYAVEAVVISALLSVVTLPAITGLASVLFC